MKKRKWPVLLAVLLAVLLLAAAALDQRLILRQYTVQSEKISRHVRLAVLADLHECDYGPDGLQIMQAVEAQGVDAFLIAGDLFADGGDYAYAASVLRRITAHYPAYYVTGNHEYWTNEVDRLTRIVEECGATLLNMESELLTIGGQSLRICGVPDPYAMVYSGVPDTATQLAQVAAQVQPGEFTLLLAHRPELIEVYARHPFDLVVSGHAHGGQVRIPGLVNGLCAPNQGWFPRYAGGEYQVGATTLIVSRGLSTQAQWYVPRLFNRPEMVLIDLIPAGK